MRRGRGRRAVGRPATASGRAPRGSPSYPTPGGATGSTCAGHLLRRWGQSACPVPARLAPRLNLRQSLCSPGGQEVSPDVDRLIGHLEGAEDTV